MNRQLYIEEANQEHSFNEMIEEVEYANGKTIFYYNKNYISGKTFQYEIFDGIWLVYHDIVLPNSEILPLEETGMIRMNYCILGRCELELKSNKVFYVGAGDFVAAFLKDRQLKHTFPSGLYKGISIVTSKNKLDYFLRTVFGDTTISADLLLKKIMEYEEYMILSNYDKVQEIMRDITMFNDVFWKEKAILKFGELVLLLVNNDREAVGLKGRYYDRNFTNKIKQIKKEVTEDIGSYASIEEIAQKYNISSRAFSDCFKEVYGKTYYSFVKEFRIKRAAELLCATDKSIGEIAITVGYQNASKFSRAFSDIIGVNPMNYRKSNHYDK
jgi:AraC-like DNA-binding protein